MSDSNPFYPLLAKRQAAVAKKKDCPIRQKLLAASPDVRRAFLKLDSVELRAKANGVDNFVLCYLRAVVNEMMQVIIDDLCDVPATPENADWWNSGFPERERTSSRTDDHQEIEELAREMAKSVYYEIRGKQVDD